MIDLFVGVDGTGVGDDAQYSVDFANSCVREWSLIWHLFNDESSSAKQAYYLRGPNMTDTSPRTKDTAQNIITLILESARLSKQENRALNIHLAGYSRGGAAVLMVCNELQKADIKIEALLLYDAEDRSRVTGVELVPDNVRYAIHAMRHPDTDSRPEFGNCGTGVQDKKKTTWVVNRSFRCTHGGMGGVPWRPPQEPEGFGWKAATSQAVDGVMAGLLGGPAGIALAAARRQQLDEHQRKGMIVETRPSIVPDNRAMVSYQVDQAESDRVRFWMKLQWKLRRTLTSRVYPE